MEVYVLLLVLSRNKTKFGLSEKIIEIFRETTMYDGSNRGFRKLEKHPQRILFV